MTDETNKETPVDPPAATPSGNGSPRLDPRFAGIKDLLSRQQVLDKKDLAFKIVEVPEWETAGASKVIVQELSAEGRDIWERQTISQAGDNTLEVNLSNARAKLVQLSVIDASDGLLLFGIDDVESLGRLSGAAMQRVYEVSAKLSKLGKEDVKALLKDLEPTSAGDSNSDSPSDSATPAASS